MTRRTPAGDAAGRHRRRRPAGPDRRATTRRADVVERLVALLRTAAERGADLVVFPELALTTFFPRWWYEDGDPALDAWYETEVPGPDTKPLWDEAVRLGVGLLPRASPS